MDLVDVDVMNWMDRYHWRALVNELVNIPISSQLCYVTMETIWKNTGDGRTILRWIMSGLLIRYSVALTPGTLHPAAWMQGQNSIKQLHTL